MPRTARIVIPELAIHLVQRGINRADCFFAEKDYSAYLGCLAHYAARFECSVHAYCLMTNHVHLLVTPHAAGSCAALMKNLAQRHAQRMNVRLERKGPLWEGRFRSGLVACEHHLLACYRYIEMNPVRAGLVASPAEYRWSSHCANAGGEAARFITPHAAYLGLAASDEHRPSAYLALFEQPVEQNLLDEIRKATSGGFVIGSPRKPRGRRGKK
jgi:putative transposase